MTTLNITGKIWQKHQQGFDAAIMDTLFNKRDYGRRPEMMVIPENVADIIATVRYAKSVGLKISVCSGGHSWSANHLRPLSILINMERFNKFEVNQESKTAKAEPAVGGSTLLSELYKINLFFPAGHCKGVCIGGYLLQGGFAWNGRKLGMACESVIGMDIVTAEGDLVHASLTENSDLFWAARGSGGGFFGVVVRFHLRLYPLPKYRGIMEHTFNIKHLEDVFRWVHEVGPSVSPAVEFQMLMSRKTLGLFGTGIEATATVFADSEDELQESVAFMKNSPIKKKAFLRTPLFDIGIKNMYRLAMSHYPENHHWGVDNMWTGAGIDDLMPHLKEIAATLPPAPSHFLWLNWYPPVVRQNMAFSMENNTYLALYGCWKSAADTPKYGNWATEQVKKMEHLGTGIQLADENLHNRSARFVSDQHLGKLDAIRAQRDPSGIFNMWHSRPSEK
jgi:FAD binding domain